MKPKPPPFLGRLVVTLGLAFGAFGCGGDFTPFNRLTTLRVLAIMPDPPTPAFGETTTLTPLVYQPMIGVSEAPANLTYAWSWCPFPGSANEGYPCKVTQAELAQLGPAGASLPPLDLGAGPTAMLPHSIDPAVLAQLCAGVMGVPQVLDCEGGFPVQIKMTVKSPTDEIVSVATVRLRYQASSTPNARPVITALAAQFDSKDSPPVPFDVPITEDPTGVKLPRLKETIIKAALPPDTAEVYLGKNDMLEEALVRERLILAWFVEAGDTLSSQTSYIEGEVAIERATRNKWTPPVDKDYPGTTARLVVVARDNRGGISWKTGLVTFTPPEMD